MKNNKITISRLSKYNYLKIDIDEIKETLAELSYYKSSNYSGVCTSHHISNPTESFSIKLENLISSLQDKLEDKLDELEFLESFIDNIEEQKIETIVRMKFINSKSWNDIAKELNYDRSSVYKQVKTYLIKHNQKNS